MDRHDPLRSLLDGTGCTVCGGRLDTARARVLAEREDLVFVELPCISCRASSLGMITRTADGPAPVDLGDPPGVIPVDGGRRSPPPIDEGDVREMRRFLAGHRGDLRSLLEGPAVGGDGEVHR
jgi:hypothetical protein